jgi:homoserine dehydrogenase
VEIDMVINVPNGRASRVAIVGFGTVGRSVARILCSNEVPQLQLTRIFNRGVARKRVDWVPPSVAWTESIDEALAPDVDLVVELVGGLEPADGWVRRALESGKSVVTANKQLIAHRGASLVELADRCGCELRFEASVAGGVPVLRALQDGLAGDRLVSVTGIVNGTCAYILSRMEHANLRFADALAEAQAAGFAEADPSEDVDGSDAAAKLSILSAIGLRLPVRAADIAARSIRPIERVDFNYAFELGRTIRQIAHASVQPDGSVIAAVGPALVPLDSGFGRVTGSENLVTVRGIFGGETSFLGSGAGGSPTAVAVVSDLLSIHRAWRRRDEHAAGPLTSAARQVSGDIFAPHYVRFVARDRTGIIAAVGSVFARYGLNIDAVLQLPDYPKDRLPFVATLEPCSDSEVRRALADIATLDWVVEPPLSLPMLPFGARREAA